MRAWAFVLSMAACDRQSRVARRWPPAGFVLEDERGESRALNEKDALGVDVSYEDGDIIPTRAS